MRDTRRFARSAGLVAALLFLAASLAQSQARRPMSLLDLLAIPRLNDPQLSRDGRQVLVTIDRPDWKQNRRIAHIWRANADGTGLTQLTFGEKGESSPRWSPDGRRIAFLAKRGDSDETQIYLLEADGGEARPLSKHATSVSNLSWAPDGASLYFLAPDPKTAEEKERDTLKDDVYAFDENYKQKHLWRLAVSDGAERKLTDGDFSMLDYTPSRDGSKIVLHRAPTPLLGDAEKGEVWVMDAGGANAVQLTRNGVQESEGQLSPDNSQALFLADANQQFESYYDGNLFLVPAGGGQARLLLPDFPHGIDGAAWSKDGRSIYLLVNMGVRSELYQVDLATRTPRPITDGTHALQGWSFVSDADRHVFQMDEPARSEIWTLAASATTPSRVTRVHEYLERDFSLARQEKIQWKGADGVTVEGIVFYPADYQAGIRYPLCVQTHGGPAASDKFGLGSWGSYVHVLTGKGYVVLKPNYRGSTGYGNAFLRDMVGSYFKNSHLDVMAGVDHLIALGVADPDRLVKMGWSGGGHMTNKIITFTDRFKAASSGAGAGNWISMYAQSDIRTYRTPWFGGTPWQKNAPTDLYWEHSPLKYVSNVKTPTIFLVGDEDPRVPPPQSVEMFRALRSLGVLTHLYRAPREPHGWTELRHQLFKMNVELEWFEKYARNRSYTWERAPAESGKDTPKPTQP